MGTRWKNQSVENNSPLIANLRSIITVPDVYIYYNRPLFIRGIDKNCYFTSFVGEDLSKIVCSSTRINKEEENFEFRFEKGLKIRGSSDNSYNLGTNGYLRATSKLKNTDSFLIRCRRKDGDIYDRSGFLCAQFLSTENAYDVYISDKIVDGCEWIVETYFDNNPVTTVVENGEYFLRNKFCKKHLHVDYKSGSVGCSWNDQGNWQRLSFSHN